MLRSARAAVLALAVAALLPACAACPTYWSTWGPCPSSWGKTPAAATATTPTSATTASAVLVPGLPEVTIVGQPDDADWPMYNARGYMTVVNFRTSAEGADAERGPVVSNAMEYFHVPVAGPNVTVGAADALAKILAGAGNQRVLLHCSSGNRAAGVWAVYLAKYHGYSADAAVAAGDSAGITKDKVRVAVRKAIAGI